MNMQKKLVKSSYLSSIGTNFGVHALSRTDSATTKLTLDSCDVTVVAVLSSGDTGQSGRSLY